MLRELRIRNFALVDSVAIEFGLGLNVITGETGAGKTILFEALSILLGGKSSKPLVREGADHALFQGLFDISDINQFSGAEYADEDGALLIERKVPKTGRGRVEANGRLIPLDRLRVWAGELIDIHGQSEKEGLLESARQRAYLDLFARAHRERDAFSDALVLAREARSAYAAEEKRLDSIRQREDYLRWQLREIEEAGLLPGEQEELEERERILKEAEQVREAIWFARDVLHEGEGAAVDRLGEAADKLERFDSHGEEAPAAAEACRRAICEIDDALLALNKLNDRVDSGPEGIDQVIERLEAIRGLKRKYKRSVEEILEYSREIGEEIADLDRGEAALRDLERIAKAHSEEASLLADKLSKKRRIAATRLGKRIEKGLADLAFRGARFSISVLPNEDPDGEVTIGEIRARCDRNGADRVEFRFAGNRGEELHPLRRVASGGELSRVMLALKRVIADAAQVPTALFDEIDAGVGGDVGEKIADALREVGRGRQIVCITHLPAIASQADRHLRVEKKVSRGRTLIGIRTLDSDQRVDELVRMMGGDSRRDVSVPHAEEILRAAREGS